MDKTLRIDPALIVEQRWRGWPDMHPEDYCHRCGTRNFPAWSVDSKLWNLAVEQLGLMIGAILCPQCFYEGIEYVIGQTWWTLVPGDYVLPDEGAGEAMQMSTPESVDSAPSESTESPSANQDSCGYLTVFCISPRGHEGPHLTRETADTETDWHGIHNDEGAELLREVVKDGGEWSDSDLWTRIDAWAGNDEWAADGEAAPTTSEVPGTPNLVTGLPEPAKWEPPKSGRLGDQAIRTSSHDVPTAPTGCLNPPVLVAGNRLLDEAATLLALWFTGHATTTTVRQTDAFFENIEVDAYAVGEAVGLTGHEPSAHGIPVGASAPIAALALLLEHVESQPCDCIEDDTYTVKECGRCRVLNQVHAIDPKLSLHSNSKDAT